MRPQPEYPIPSTEDILPRKLAAELGIEKYEVPEEDINNAIRVFVRIIKIIREFKEWKEGLFHFLIQNKEVIFAVFDAFRGSHRFPLYVSTELYKKIKEEGGEALYMTVLDSWRWYACWKSLELDTQFFLNANINDATLFARWEGERMLKGSWGRSHSKWLRTVGQDPEFIEAVRAKEEAKKGYLTRNRQLDRYQIDAVQGQLRTYFLYAEGSFDVLFTSDQSTLGHPKIGIPALNFLLCQSKMHDYKAYVNETTKESPRSMVKCLPIWSEWIKLYFSDLMKPDSEIRKVFYMAFELEGNLFEQGKVPKRLRRKNACVTKGLPEDLCQILEGLYQDEKESLKAMRRYLRAAVSRNLPQHQQMESITKAERRFRSGRTSQAAGPSKGTIIIPDMRTLFISGGDKKQLPQLDLSRVSFPEGTTVQFERQIPGRKTNETIPAELGQVKEIEPILGQDNKGQFLYRLTIALPGGYCFTDGKTETILEHRIHAEKKIIDVPDKSSLFIRSGDKKQLAKLDLSGVSFPEGTTVQFERQVPKKNTFEIISVELEKVNEIEPILGQDYKGHFIYRLTVILPGEYRFPDSKTKTILEQKIYAEADPTPDEIEVPKNTNLAPIRPAVISTKTVPSLVTATSNAVASVLHATRPKQKTLADTVTAWEMADEEGSITLELRNDGVVIFHLPDEFIDDLHDASFEVLQITPDSTIHPDIGGGNIASQLQDIARELREKKGEERNLALQAEQEEKEYQTLRAQFQPFYVFIGEQVIFDKDKKEVFETALKEFNDSLRDFGWTKPWRLRGSGQICIRHIDSNIMIQYNSQGAVLKVERQGKSLSPIEKKVYREIAEAFSHLALFYTADYRERQSMIGRERKLQKDLRQGAEAYEALLDEGRARLVQYSSDWRAGVHSSHFPLDGNPSMLAEKVSHDTVKSVLRGKPCTMLCYRRDILRFNGEMTDADAVGCMSLENTLQNLADLRQSSRGRYILKKRILITLEFEKYSGDDTRAPIQESRTGESHFTAYNILQSLVEKKKILSSEQIDDEFLNAYIDKLIEHRIRVQYVWPLSVTLNEHRDRLSIIKAIK